MRRYELTNEEWKQIKDLLPPERTGKKGRPRKDNRTMLNGMLWIARTGCQWRELPEYYGKWRDEGVLEYISVFYPLMLIWKISVLSPLP